MRKYSNPSDKHYKTDRSVWTLTHYNLLTQLLMALEVLQCGLTGSGWRRGGVRPRPEWNSRTSVSPPLSTSQLHRPREPETAGQTMHNFSLSSYGGERYHLSIMLTLPHCSYWQCRNEENNKRLRWLLWISTFYDVQTVLSHCYSDHRLRVVLHLLLQLQN